jgi:hypothetical protein
VEAGSCQAVYYGYQPLACTTLTAMPSSGAAPYSYLWSNGSTTASISVCPTTTTVYSVSVTDATNTTASDQVTVEVVDVRCGNNNNNKVQVCHIGNNGTQTRCVSQNQVAGHLAHGDQLGACGTTPCGGPMAIIAEGKGFGEYATLPTSLTCEPNPFQGQITFRFSAPDAPTPTSLTVLDGQGRAVAKLLSGEPVQGAQVLHWEPAGMPGGLYFVQLRLAGELQTQRIVLAR